MTSPQCPQDWLEQSLADLIGRRINPDENFFDAGANSLILMRVHARLTTDLVPDAQLSDFFAFPTLRSLARQLEAAWPVQIEPTLPRSADRVMPPPPVGATIVSVPLEADGTGQPQAAAAPTIDRAATPSDFLHERIATLVGRRIGGDVNFFDAGLNSLLLMRLHAAIVTEVAPQLALAEMFDFPTVDLLAPRMHALGYAAVDIAPSDTADASPAIGSPSPWFAPDRHIAVIGMAVDLPGAPDLKTFYDVIATGTDCIERFGNNAQRPDGATFVRARAMLHAPLDFDAAFFGLAPREAALMDPQQRILLMTAARTLANAGIAVDRSEAKNIGVFASASENAYLRRIWKAEEQGVAIDPFLISLLNEKDMLSSRIAYHFNLVGPAMTVQTACSSSLTAVHLACEQLRSGHCEMFLVGGVSIDVECADGYVAPAEGIYAPDGYCRAFAENAQGTVPGSGAAMVLLKPLDAALRDGDRIYAVIGGTAINNDGSQKVNIAAPSERGQAVAIASAHSDARIACADIGYIEAHGTGTRLGDPIEFRALTHVFGARGDGSCAIGSVKSQMGHLGAAAGIVGFIRAALSVYHGIKPASLHAARPNGQIALAGSPFTLLSQSVPWADAMRIAGVSSFGIGGANAHVVLAAPPTHAHNAAIPAWDSEPVPFENHRFDILGTVDSPSLRTSHWFYRPAWRPYEPTPRVAHVLDVPPKYAVMIGAGDAFVTGALTDSGYEVIQCAVASELDHIFAHHAISLAVYLAPTDISIRTHSSMAAATDAYITMPIEIVRAWNRHRSGEAMRLVTFVHGLGVDAGDDVVPSAALLIGPQTVLPLEITSLSSALIDISDGQSCHSAAVMALLDGPCGVFAIRGGTILKHCLEADPNVGPAKAAIEPGDVVVITGGTGGIGQALTEEILKTRDTKVVSLSRSAGDFVPTATGRVFSVACDVSDPAAVCSAIDQIIDAFGSIDGVIHAAGLPGSGMALVQGAENRSAVLAPKVMGAIALDQAMANHPARITIYCSSLSSHVAVPGQVDYSASNAFLDAQARSRAGDGANVISINWPSWHDTGIARGVDVIADGLNPALQISRSTGQNLLHDALARGWDTVIISPLAPQDLAQSLAGYRPFHKIGMAPLARNDAGPREILSEIFAQALEVETCHAAQSFFEQGGDSWRAMMIVDALQNRIDPSISMADFIAHPSIDAMTRHIARQADRCDPGLGEPGSVVVMRQGAGPPIIIVHPVGGDIIGYRDIVAHIHGRMVLGVRGFGPANDVETLREQAEIYFNALPNLAGAVLVGWSYGALVAREIAAIAHERGDAIAKIILIDPPLPEQRLGPVSQADLLKIAIAERIAGTDDNSATGEAGALSQQMNAPLVLAACAANTARMIRHSPSGIVPCPAQLFIASDRPTSWADAATLTAEWRRAVTSIAEIVTLPGDHYACVLGENAARLGAAIVNPNSTSPKDIL